MRAERQLEEHGHRREHHIEPHVQNLGLLESVGLANGIRRHRLPADCVVGEKVSDRNHVSGMRALGSDLLMC